MDRGKSNPFGYLSLPDADDAENRYSWALFTVMGRSSNFRSIFLRKTKSIHDKSRMAVKLTDVRFQERIRDEIPDLLISSSALDGNRRRSKRVLIEVKVDSAPSKDQLKRYASLSRSNVPAWNVVLISPNEPDFRLPKSVVHLSWADIWGILKEAERNEKNDITRFLLTNLANKLEENGMSGFQGFDKIAAMKCAKLVRENGEVIRKVRRQAQEFLNAIADDLDGRMGGERPFDAFQSRRHSQDLSDPAEEEFGGGGVWGKGVWYRRKGKGNHGIWAGIYINDLTLEITVGFGGSRRKQAHRLLTKIGRSESKRETLKRLGYRFDWFKGSNYQEGLSVNLGNIRDTKSRQPSSVEFWRRISAVEVSKKSNGKRIVNDVIEELKRACKIARGL